MTDSPKTLSLNARQWRVLMNDHLEVLKAGVASSETLDETGLKNIMRHMDEVRLMAAAWYQNSPVPDAANQQAQEQQAGPQTNGAVPKRTGGWPKGKPRKRQMPAQAVQ